MPKACTVRRARNSGRNAKRGVAHRSDGSRRYSTLGQALGLDLPISLLAGADDVIE
jgi:hypothetical protein